MGSAVCVFTFGTSNDDIGNVFNGEYLRRKTDGSGIWETVDNYDNDNTNNPFTVSCVASCVLNNNPFTVS